MQNLLEITGKINPVTTPENKYDFELDAVYNHENFGFSKVTGMIRAMIVHFSRKDRLYIPNGLNNILLITNGINYKATGLTLYDAGGKPKMYTMGDDLEINIDDSAKIILRELESRILQ